MRGKVRGFSIVRGSALIDQINKPHPFLQKLLSSQFNPNAQCFGCLVYSAWLLPLITLQG
jgi:hypothetical protein